MEKFNHPARQDLQKHDAGLTAKRSPGSTSRTWAERALWIHGAASQWAQTIVWGNTVHSGLKSREAVFTAKWKMLSNFRTLFQVRTSCCSAQRLQPLQCACASARSPVWLFMPASSPRFPLPPSLSGSDMLIMTLRSSPAAPDFVLSEQLQLSFNSSGFFCFVLF